MMSRKQRKNHNKRHVEYDTDLQRDDKVVWVYSRDSVMYVVKIGGGGERALCRHDDGTSDWYDIEDLETPE